MKKFSSDYCFRMFFKRKNVLIILFLLLIGSCSSPLYKPTIHQIEDNANLEELKSGRKAYIKKCSSCHHLIKPEKFTAEEWQSWVDKMEKIAKLDEGEKGLILNYVTKGKINQ